MDIYIDADACPVKEEAITVAARHELKVYLVSNSWLRIQVPDHVEKVVVPGNFDAADDWIAERAQKGDIVVTADIPLASRNIKQGAIALSPTGKIFTDGNIGAVLAMRNLNAYLRETGVISGHNASFSKQTRSNFLQALEQAIQKAKRV